MSAPATLEEAFGVFEPVIGLEVHAQLRTTSKIFCAAATEFSPDAPNKNIQAYCIGLPGVLPVLNRNVVEMAIRAGLALNCDVRNRSVWSRKHYFYPDLPKGYQISQYDEPICEHGHLDIADDAGSDKRVRIMRIHMEEDAGKNTHVSGAPMTLLDYNRAGVPLIEIVSEPDIRSAGEASRYLKSLRSILMTLDVCDGNMEEGSFRCDANVSIRAHGETALGTRCEIKNINSFRFVEQAIGVEILRHAKIVATGGTIHQETRLYDSQQRVTRSLRSKEEAHDYRYFPDPDLPPLVISDDWIATVKDGLPELPVAKRARWQALGVPDETTLTFSEEQAVGAFFDAAVAAEPALAVAISNFVKGEVLHELKDSPQGIADAKLKPTDLAALVKLKAEDRISSTQEKKLFHKMWKDGTPLATLMQEEGEQVSDSGVLAPVVDEILTRHPEQVQQFKEGKTKVLGFLMGQVMKATKGKGKPQMVKDLILAGIEKV